MPKSPPENDDIDIEADADADADGPTAAEAAFPRALSGAAKLPSEANTGLTDVDRGRARSHRRRARIVGPRPSARAESRAWPAR